MNNYQMKIPSVEVKQKEWTPADPLRQNYDRLIVREHCTQDGPAWEVVKDNNWHSFIAGRLDEDTAKRLAGCWNQCDGFSTDLLAHPIAPRFLDRLFASGAAYNKAVSELSDSRTEMSVIETALKVMTRAMDELVSACLDENGKPKAPDMRSLMKARGYLPPKCANAFPSKAGEQKP